MQPVVRIDDYVNEYVRLIHETYNKYDNVYFVTYYRIDKENSTWDDHYKSSYDFIGDKSGLKWNKIYNVPIFQAEPISPELDFSDRGLNKGGSTTTFNISPEVPIIPRSGDLMVTNVNGDLSVFQINGTSFDVNRNFNQVYTKAYASFIARNLSEIENQISDEFVYVEPLHKIYQKQIAYWILKLFENLSYQFSKKLMIENYDHILNCYLFDKEDYVNIFIPEINYYLTQNILQNSFRFINDKITFDHDYSDYNVPNDTVISILLNPEHQNLSNPIIYKYTIDDLQDDMLYINSTRFHYYPVVNVMYPDNNSDQDIFNILGYSEQERNNLHEAIDMLYNYLQGTNIDPNTLHTYPDISAVIKYYLTIKTNWDRRTQFYPELIKHIMNTNNILEYSYSIWISLYFLNNDLLNQEKVFN